jgi:hypothetical protein
MFAAGDKLRNRCRYQADRDWVPFLVDITDDKGKFVKRVPVLPPFKFDRKATAPAPTYPPLVCQHCIANHTFPATTAETDGAESETTVTDNEDEDEGDNKLDVITSISSYLGKYTSDVSFHHKEWVTGVQMEYGHPFSLNERRTPFLVKLPCPTKPKWGAKFGPEVVCMVVPPTAFDMVCAGCTWREGKVNVVKVTTFNQNCCAKDDPCRFLWQGISLPKAIDPVFTELEMYSHGNPPVAAAAVTAETAATDDDKETATADAAAGVVDKKTANVNDEAELQFGGLPPRPHHLLDLPTIVPLAPAPPYTGKAQVWRPPNTVPFAPPPHNGKLHRLLDLPPTVPLAPPPYTGKPHRLPTVGNLPLSKTMAREAMNIADEATAAEATAAEATAYEATADEASAAATLGTMRQVDPLIVVGKKKRNRQIADPAPPAPPGPTRRSTRATKNNKP